MVRDANLDRAVEKFEVSILPSGVATLRYPTSGIADGLAEVRGIESSPAVIDYSSFGVSVSELECSRGYDMSRLSKVLKR